MHRVFKFGVAIKWGGDEMGNTRDKVDEDRKVKVSWNASLY